MVTQPGNQGSNTRRLITRDLAGAAMRVTALQGVAVRLANTYKLRKDAHNSAKHLTGPLKIHTWTEEFGDMTRRKRGRVGCENIEERQTTATTGPEADLWMKIAQLVVACRFDPEKFVHRQFSELSASAHAPSIQTLLSPAAIHNYEQSMQNLQHDLRISLISNNSVFRINVAMTVRGRKLADEAAQEYVLLNDVLEMSPMFRYCMARAFVQQPRTKDKHLFAYVAVRYQISAAFQYVFAADAYMVAWGDFIPADFPEIADKLYRQTIQQPGSETEFE